MEIKYMETVLAVARLGSFSKAAFEIPCSQSSVSRQIKNVEDELGVILFERSCNTNTVVLTPLGEELMPIIKRIMDEYQTLQDVAEVPRRRKQLILNLGIASSIFSSSGKAILSSNLYLEYPEISMNVKDVPTSAFIDHLKRGILDVILCYQTCLHGELAQPFFDDPALISIPLLQKELSIAAGETHRLATRECVSFAELAEEYFVFNTNFIMQQHSFSANNQHTMFLEACQRNGFLPKILSVDRNLADTKQVLVARGDGIYPSFTPNVLRKYPGIRYISVNNSPYYARYFLLTFQQRSKVINDFAEFLKQFLTED